MSENRPEITEQFPTAPQSREDATEVLFDLRNGEYQHVSLTGANNAIEISDQPALFSEADIIVKTGVNLGELVAMVQLPYAQGLGISKEEKQERSQPLRMYCFKQTEAGDNSNPKYTIMGDSQIRRIKNGEDPSSVDYLSLEKPGDIRFMGRDMWMPSKEGDDSKVSRVQGSFSVGLRGQLVVQVPSAYENKNPTTITVGKRHTPSL